MIDLPKAFFLLGITSSAAASAHGQIPKAGAASLPGESLHECTGFSPSGHGELRCFESKNGWFLTADADTAWANKVNAAVGVAAARFERAFGKPVGRGVVTHTGVSEQHVGPVATPGTAFSPQGSQWTWSWLSMGPQLMMGMNLHELGHMWLAQNYSWPQRVGHHYGTSAADWLDESAAILMEDSAVTEWRRARLIEAYVKDGPSGHESVVPLDTLFTMNHPAENNDGAKVDFYGECRGVIDFLTERTGDERIFGAIAANEAHGSTVVEWLRTNGAQYHLPTEMSDLEREWRNWLAKQATAGIPRAPAVPAR